MIAEYGIGRTFLNHIPDQIDCFPDFGPPVNEIAYKNSLTGRMRITGIDQLIPHLFQQTFKLIGMAMNITNNIVHKKIARMIYSGNLTIF
jgi:hypothetical protein